MPPRRRMTIRRLQHRATPDRIPISRSATALMPTLAKLCAHYLPQGWSLSLFRSSRSSFGHRFAEAPFGSHLCTLGESTWHMPSTATFLSFLRSPPPALQPGWSCHSSALRANGSSSVGTRGDVIHTTRTSIFVGGLATKFLPFAAEVSSTGAMLAREYTFD